MRGRHRAVGLRLTTLACVADRRAPTPLQGPAAVALLVVAFAIELAAVAFVGAGVLAAVNTSSRWPFAAAAVVLTVLMWARWVAPRAPHRLADPRRLVLELTVYLCGTAGLVRVTGTTTAWLAFALAAVVALLARISALDE